MYTTIFKLAWPFLEKRLAQQAADYLQARRDKRLNVQLDSDSETDPCEGMIVPPARTFWPRDILLTAIGLLVGSGIGFAISQFMAREE